MHTPVRSHRTRRHAALLTLAVVVASAPFLAASPVGAAECASGTSCVVVTVVSTVDGKDTVRDEYVVTPADIAAWSDLKDTDVQYTRRSEPSGKVTDGPLVAAGKGLSLNALLAQLDARNDTTLRADSKFTETPNTASVPSVLSKDDIANPSDAKFPPAVYLTDKPSELGYVRPLPVDKTDVNATDQFTVTGRLDLTVRLTGRLLGATVKVASTDVTTKTKNAFSVDFTNKPDNVQVKTFTWDFGDGSSATTAAPTHTFAKRATFPVVVSVRASDGSYGRSAAVQMKVDNPPKAPSSGSGGTGGGAGGGGFGGGFTPPFNPGNGGLPAGQAPGDSVPSDISDNPVPDGLEQVEGFVLAGAELAPGGTAEQIPGTQDSTQAAPVGQESVRRRIATWTIVALAAALLLGAGAASETRWTRTRLRHLRRRA